MLISSHLSASICWETFTYPRLSVGLASVRGRKFILSPKIKGRVLGICILYDIFVNFRYFADRASQYIYLNVNQLDALNFIMSLFHDSTCFEHKCSSSGGPNCTIQSLVTSHSVGGRPVHGTATYRVWWYQRLYNTVLPSWRWAHVLETCRGSK